MVQGEVGGVTCRGAVHMAVARLGCKRAMVGTEWANFHPGCMNRRRKHYSHFLRGSFLAGKAVWTLTRYFATENPDYVHACLLMSGHG